MGWLGMTVKRTCPVAEERRQPEIGGREGAGGVMTAIVCLKETKELCRLHGVRVTVAELGLLL
ncbi:hypothetical protein D3C76_1709460 [compost metagenome]